MLPVRNRLQLFLLPASLKFFKPLTIQKTRFIFKFIGCTGAYREYWLSSMDT